MLSGFRQDESCRNLFVMEISIASGIQMHFYHHFVTIHFGFITFLCHSVLKTLGYCSL